MSSTPNCSRRPKIKFTDLSEEVNSKVILNPMPFDVRSDFVKVTSDTVLVPVTIQMRNRDITFVNKEGVQRGTVNIYGKLSTLTGKIVQTFEDTVQVDVPAELLPRTAENASVYWKALPLRAGHYKLYIAVKDVNGDRKGVYSRSVTVPEYTEDKLATSSLIIADQMEPVPTKAIGSGSFVIGTTKVRPRVGAADGKPAVFKRDRDPKLNFWMQVYNLGCGREDAQAFRHFRIRHHQCRHQQIGGAKRSRAPIRWAISVIRSPCRSRLRLLTFSRAFTRFRSR